LAAAVLRRGLLSRLLVERRRRQADGRRSKGLAGAVGSGSAARKDQAVNHELAAQSHVSRPLAARPHRAGAYLALPSYDGPGPAVPAARRATLRPKRLSGGVPASGPLHEGRWSAGRPDGAHPALRRRALWFALHPIAWGAE